MASMFNWPVLITTAGVRQWTMERPEVQLRSPRNEGSPDPHQQGLTLSYMTQGLQNYALALQANIEAGASSARSAYLALQAPTTSSVFHPTHPQPTISALTHLPCRQTSPPTRRRFATTGPRTWATSGGSPRFSSPGVLPLPESVHRTGPWTAAHQQGTPAASVLSDARMVVNAESLWTVSNELGGAAVLAGKSGPPLGWVTDLAGANDAMCRQSSSGASDTSWCSSDSFWNAGSSENGSDITASENNRVLHDTVISVLEHLQVFPKQELEQELLRHFEPTLFMEEVCCGMDPRRTLMIRNIPNRFDEWRLCQVINPQFAGRYTRLYLVPDGVKNKGYAFVTMKDHAAVAKFVECFQGKHWEGSNSNKRIYICYARDQWT